MNSALLKELTAIKDYLGAAQTIIRDGYMPDMAVLEKRVSDLCRGLQAAEPEEQSRCLPELATLLKCLDACEQDMHAWKAARAGTDAS